MNEVERTERTRAWHKIVQLQQPARLNELLADDVVFCSPVVYSPQRGKKIACQYLLAAFSILNNNSFRYVREINGAEHSVLEFEVEIDGIYVNGVDMISWNQAGQITEFKVMIRPLQAIELVHRKMQAMLMQAS